MQKITHEQDKLKQQVADILTQAKALGASSAEVDASISDGFTTSVRLGEVDTLEYQRDKGVSITLYYGQRKGSASTSDTSTAAIQQALEAAKAIAEYTAEDPFNGLAEKSLLAFGYPDLDLYHPWDISPEQAISLAKECEAKAMAYDKRINNSEGASVTSHQGVSVYGNSNGFIGAYAGTRHSISCGLVAEDGGYMQRDYDYTNARDALDLAAISDLALSAAKRTVARLKGRKLKTQKSPVIFRADVARSLLGFFISAISGSNLYRESSFLLNSLGQKIFPKHINVFENPHLKKALGSAAFDAEGVTTKDRNIITHGILEGYVLGSYSARKLKMQTTGNAGGVHNLMISNSEKNLQELLRAMGTGLFITETIGNGVNIVSGDYSQGAAGFWVENGEIAYPVEEITIAGNLKDMFLNIVEVANDIDIRGNIRTGSMFIAEMMVAGE